MCVTVTKKTACQCLSGRKMAINASDKHQQLLRRPENLRLLNYIYLGAHTQI